MCYSTQFNQSYENEAPHSTTFNGILIEDIDEFSEQYVEDLKDVFELGSKHLQSIGLRSPRAFSEYLDEGTVVTVEEAKSMYLGVIRSNKNADLDDIGVPKGSEAQTIKVQLIYKYNKPEDQQTLNKFDQERINQYNKLVEISLTKYRTISELSIHTLSVLSDEYLLNIFEDNATITSMKI